MLSRRTLLVLAAGEVRAAGRPEPLSVKDLDGKRHEFAVAGKTTLVIFYSTICPISNEYNERIAQLHRDYTAKGAQVLILNANQNETVEEIRKHVRAAEFAFPVYLDARNVVADRLKAAVTPEAFVVDTTGVTRYHGAIDDSKNPARIHNHFVRDALDAVLAGKAVAKPEGKAFGCTIKRVRKS